jgi:signal transduction histidine kinase
VPGDGQFTEAHGGEIVVADGTGAPGATFVLRFPVGAAPC